MGETMQLSSGEKWQKAWQSKIFRKKVILGFAALFGMLSTFPLFFQTIEKRSGTALNDWLLTQLPAYNVSTPIFLIVWVATLFILIRSYQNPGICVTFLWSYIFLNITRVIIISLVALEPPAGILILRDPIINNVYGLQDITKDLFYSGHTSTLFLMFLCMQTRMDKILMLVCAFVVGFLLLVQHAHYTIDVLAAPVFSYLMYRLTKRILPVRAGEMDGR
jgi:hypothetical protein